jgi:hypothetical protein
MCTSSPQHFMILPYLVTDLIVIVHEVVAQKGVHAVIKAVAGVLGTVVTARRSRVGQTERRARRRVNDTAMYSYDHIEPFLIFLTPVKLSTSE